MRWLGLLVLLGCDRPSTGGDHSIEERYARKEVAELPALLAARDEAKVMTSCGLATSSLDTLPAKLADDVRRLCHVEAPRLQLELAIEAVKQGNAKHPDMAEIHCIQPFLDEALRTIKAHPSSDAGLTHLVAELAALCPAEAAKAR
jgi:hypothetical protein